MKYIIKENNIRSLMLKKGYNLTTIAKKMNVSSAYISLIINGKRSPSPILAKKISKCLEVKIEEIFEINIKNKL
ncbi:helix-turn-helix transcriptional regulator [Macrococcoides bohemicum]|uniref:helix-turn-helix transcriptional regulator n=1 Tax=Macrococcoides bohemicum TaxID=1903056 RepID=UPI00193F3AEE|nr:helix-turn-helix transcriptional regulator [Macrococcus bohemicus]QRN49976.1 helix-turn-helix transcriptional regulator [Macrococcus bohemicus]